MDLNIYPSVKTVIVFRITDQFTPFSRNFLKRLTCNFLCKNYCTDTPILLVHIFEYDINFMSQSIISLYEPE